MTTYLLLKTLHVFGWSLWLAGLTGTAVGQVAARRGASAESRAGAWSVVTRLQGLELLGLVVAPVTGLVLAAMLAGGAGAIFTTPSLRFVHVKLVLAIVAIVLNLVAVRLRRDVPALLPAGGPALDGRLKRLAMVHGIATLMLPLAILAVLWMR